MVYNKNSILGLLFLLLGPLLHAQDRAIAQLDKSFYVSGETVWYNLFLPARFEGSPVTVNAFILNPGKEVVAAHYSATGKTIACNGHFDLPLTSPTGMYALVFTAVNTLSEIQLLAQISLPVYNDLKPPMEAETPTSIPVTATVVDSLNVTIKEIGKIPTGKRDTRSFEVSVTDINGVPVAAKGSVSVTDESLTGTEVYPFPNIFAGEKLETTVTWADGIIRPGRLTDGNGNPITTPLLTAYNRQDEQLFFTKSEEDGRFSLQLPFFEGQRSIQIMHQYGDEIEIEWDKPVLPAIHQSITVTPGILAYLAWSRKRKMIDQVFPSEPVFPKSKKTDIKDTGENWPTRRFFKVQNYQAFPDMATFFNEVSQIVRFIPLRGQYQVKTYNPEQDREFDTTPLFIIDNKLTLDAGFIGHLSPATVASVEVLYGLKLLKKYYPALGSGGVIRIQTLNGGQQLPPTCERDIFQMNGYAIKKSFPTPPADLKRPFFSPVLAWIPDFSTNTKGLGSIKVAQSDDSSRFKIQVVVQSADGKRGTGSYSFRTVND